MATKDKKGRVILKADASGPVLKSGYLKKRGGGYTNMQKRWFVLSPAVIIYYKDNKTKQPSGEIDLEGTSVVKTPGEKADFEIAHPDRRTFFLRAVNETERDDWFKALADQGCFVQGLSQAPSRSATASDADTFRGSSVADARPSESSPGGAGHGLHADASFCGAIAKQDRAGVFKKRYFALYADDYVLKYYGSSADTMAKGTIPLAGCSLSFLDTDAKDILFQLQPQDSRPYVLQCDSSASRSAWVKALADAGVKECALQNRSSSVAKNRHEGFLFKQGGSSHTGWKKRWFTLHSHSLRYFESPTDTSEKGKIELNGSHVTTCEDGGKPHTFQIVIDSRTYHLHAETAEDKTAWIEQLLRSGASKGSEEEDILFSGHMSKQGGSNTKFQRRWFVLTPTTLKYYKDSDSMEEALGVVTLAGCVLTMGDNDRNFNIDHPDRRRYVLHCETTDSCREWMDMLNAAGCKMQMRRETAATSQHSGWLQKLGEENSSWKKRFFTLQDDVLRYYKSQECKGDPAMINLEQSTVALADSDCDKPNCFAIYTPKRPFFLHAESEEEVDDWLLKLSRAGCSRGKWGATAKFTRCNGNGLESCVAGVPASFTITTFDSHGDVIPKGGNQVEVVTAHSSRANVTTPARVVDNEDGTYSVSYVANSCGDVLITCRFYMQELPGSPITVPCSAGATDAAGCTAEGEGVTRAETCPRGALTSQLGPAFTIVSKDRYGNRVTKGGDQYSVLLSRQGGDQITAEVRDLGDGTYSVTYRVEEPGTYKMKVMMRGAHILGSPFTVEVVQGSSPDVSTSGRQSLLSDRGSMSGSSHRGSASRGGQQQQQKAQQGCCCVIS